MRPFFLIALLLGVGTLRADDTATAKALTDLGAQVTSKEGVVSKVAFKDSSKLGAAEYKLIGSLSGLKSLTLYGKASGLTDTTLPHLHGLTALEELSTDLMMVSDEGFRQFAPLKALRSLSLFHVSYQLKGFTGAGFVHLKELPNLRKLTFGGSTCNDEALIALAQVTQLRELGCWHTHSRGSSAEPLGKLTQLTSLRWGQSLGQYDGKPKTFALSDATLPALAKLVDLETLALDEAKLSLAALKELKALRKLKKLTLERIDLSAADLEQLKVELPQTEIVFKPMTAEQRKQLEATLAQPKPASK